MSKHKKRNPNALGDDCSCSQRLLVEQLNPKQAIAKSPEINDCELYDMKALPEHILLAIREHGLYDKFKTMQKMQFTVCKHRDPVEHIINYIRRTGVMPGVEPVMKSIKVK